MHRQTEIINNEYIMDNRFNHMRGIGSVRSEMIIMLDEQEKKSLISASEVLRKEARRFHNIYKDNETQEFQSLEKYYELSKIAQSLETIAGVDSL